MLHRMLVSLVLVAACASSKQTVIGPLVTRMNVADSALVVERCTVIHGVETHPGRAIAAGIGIALLTAGRLQGGGNGQSGELHVDGCQQIRQSFAVAP